MILHWLNVHIWAPMWPNIFAPSIFAVGAIVVAHVKGARHRRELEKQIKLQRHYNKNDPFTLDTPDSTLAGDGQRN